MIINSVEPRGAVRAAATSRGCWPTTTSRHALIAVAEGPVARRTSCWRCRRRACCTSKDYTDLEILREWAGSWTIRRCELLTTTLFWKPTVAEPRPAAPGIKARDHYEALRLVRDDLPGSSWSTATRTRRSRPTRDHRARASSGCAGGATRSRAIWSIPSALARFVEQTVGPAARRAARRRPAALPRARTTRRPSSRDPLGDHRVPRSTRRRGRELMPPALDGGRAAGLPLHALSRDRRRDAPGGDPSGSRREARRHREGVRAMSGFEVPEPILSSPFEEPPEHWRIVEGEPPRRDAGPPAGAVLLPRRQARGERSRSDGAGTAIELKLVNRIRERARRSGARRAGPGVTRTTLELLAVLAARRPAAAALLRPARGGRDDHLPDRGARRLPPGHRRSRCDEPSDEQQGRGLHRRSAATPARWPPAAGKTTVMGMLAAWSILNKVNDRGDAPLLRRGAGRLPERHDPQPPAASWTRDEGEASLYRTRDLVPAAPDARPDARAACSSPTGTSSSRRACRPAASAPR